MNIKQLIEALQSASKASAMGDESNVWCCSKSGGESEINGVIANGPTVMLEIDDPDTGHNC